MNVFKVNWNEDGDATCLGRVTARNGTGAATGIEGEGNFIKQADLAVGGIERKIFDLDGDTPNDPESTTNPTISVVVLDTVVTDNVIWTKDATGYNFLDDIAASNFPIGDRRYRIEYKFTLTGGAIFHGVYEGTAEPIRGS